VPESAGAGAHGYCTDEYIGAALGAGADGYVLKDASRAELLQAIRSVIAGQKYFSEPVSARLVSGYLRRNDPATDACPRITERERESSRASHSGSPTSGSPWDCV